MSKKNNGSLKVKFYYQQYSEPAIHPAQVVKLANNGFKFVRVVNCGCEESVIVFSSSKISTRQAEQRANKMLDKMYMDDLTLNNFNLQP